MAVINVNLRCDLQQPVKVQYLDGVIFSQDNQGNVINVAVFDGGEPAEISGTVSANIIRSDGGTVAATGGTITGNVASIALPAAAYAVPGVVSVVVKLTTESAITSIAAFVSNVYTSTTDTAIDPGTIIPSIDTLIAEIQAAVATIPADYSGVCQAVEVMGGLTLVTGFVNGKGYNTTNNPIDINNPTTNIAVNCTYIECQAGDKFTYTGYTTSSYRGWAFLDSTGNRLSKLPSAGQKTNEVITAPSNTVYVIFNVNNGRPYSVWRGELQEKGNKLTFDNTPTYMSENPVTSNGVFDYAKAFEVLNGVRVVPNFKHNYGYNTTGTTIDINTPTYNSAIDCASSICVS